MPSSTRREPGAKGAQAKRPVSKGGGEASAGELVDGRVSPNGLSKRPPSPPKRRTGKPASPPDPRSEPDARLKLIDAAIETILEEGFYRASSNAIADRAGLSWGVIQYYFGSREALMLAVLQEGTERLVEDLSTSDITGESLPERIESFSRALEKYYADPQYLAFIQVLLNLGRDPRTSEKTLETMTKIADGVNVQLNRLTTDLFSGMDVRQRALRGLVFHVLRGLALSEAMLGSLPYDTPSKVQDMPRQRRLAAEALSMLIARETGNSSLAGG
jgi:AcrR family transcriptional regulator